MGNSSSNSNQSNSIKPNNLRNLAQKQARRRIVGALIFAALVLILLPFLMDNSHNQMLDEVAVNIPQQNSINQTPQTSHNPPPQDQENDSKIAQPSDDDNDELNIPDVATSVNNSNSTPEEENQAVTAKIIQKQDSEKQKLTSQNQQKMIAEDKENKAKAEKDRLAKLEKEKEKEKDKENKEKDNKEKDKEKSSKNDEAKRVESILAGNFDVPKKSESKNSNQKYIISIGAFSDENNVKNLRKKLADLKIISFTEAIDGGKKIRVRAGPFSDENDAKNALNKMENAGISGKISATK